MDPSLKLFFPRTSGGSPSISRTAFLFLCSVGVMTKACPACKQVEQVLVRQAQDEAGASKHDHNGSLRMATCCSSVISRSKQGAALPGRDCAWTGQTATVRSSKNSSSSSRMTTGGSQHGALHITSAPACMNIAGSAVHQPPSDSLLRSRCQRCQHLEVTQSQAAPQAAAMVNRITVGA